mmetsp:Transcript_125239/g.365787  ORF Transcript_125239/g.365787 Transcript_125239/m.365787 type:complete len:224 (-) Transcript_125239:263-934(-)
MQIAEQRDPRTFMILPRRVRACSSKIRAWMRPSSSTKSSRLKTSSAWISVCSLFISAAALSLPTAAASSARSAASGACASHCAKPRRGSAPRRLAAGRHWGRKSTARRFLAAMSFMVRSSLCSRSATCCCVTGRRKECMLRNGKFTAPKPLSIATTVTPSTPIRAMRRSAESSKESSWIMRPERKTTYQKAGTAAEAQAPARWRLPNHIVRTEVQTKQKGSTT